MAVPSRSHLIHSIPPGRQADDYWLCVVENCQNGQDQLFAAFADPMAFFQDSMKDITLFKIPGSALSGAKQAAP